MYLPCLYQEDELGKVKFFHLHVSTNYMDLIATLVSFPFYKTKMYDEDDDDDDNDDNDTG